MAFAMIDDLTGEQHPTTAAHRLTLHLDADPGAPMDATEVAGWDVASTDPRELLAQLGEHLSGVAAPISEADVATARQKLGEVRQQIDALRRSGVMVCGPEEIGDADDQASYAEPDPNPTAQPDDEPVVGNDEPVEQDRDGHRQGDVALDEPTGAALAAHHEDPAPAPATPSPALRRPGPPPVHRPPLAQPSPAAARVAEAIGGQATDATIRLWAHQHNVPCSTTGKLNAWARAGYLRVQGGPPDQQLWDDYRAAIKPSPAARPADETPAAARPDPPAGRAAAGTPAPEPAGRSSQGPAPAPGGEAGAGAGAVTPEGDGRPAGVSAKQMSRAEDLAADGRTPREIRERTGVPLEVARALFASAKGGR